MLNPPSHFGHQGTKEFYFKDKRILPLYSLVSLRLGGKKIKRGIAASHLPIGQKNCKIEYPKNKNNTLYMMTGYYIEM